MMYYSTYIHLNESFLKNMNQSDFVPKGTLIGLTGETASLPHLHFEIRAGSLFSGHACNPWKYLPCNHCSPFRANATITFEQRGVNCSARVQVSVPPNQLTFLAVQLEITGGTSSYNRTVDLCEANIYHTNNPSYSTTRLDDNTVIPNLIIEPQFFNSASYGRNEWSAVDYIFLNLPSVQDEEMGEVVATAFDVFGETVTFQPVFYSSSCSEVIPPTHTATSAPSEPMATDGSTGSAAMSPGLVVLQIVFITLIGLGISQ